MDIKTLIGRKVTHKAFGEGIIVDIDNVCVSVDFKGNIKKFQIEALGQFFRFDNEEIRELIQKVLDEIKAAKDAAEAAKKAAEEAARIAEEAAAAERALAAQRDRQRNHNRLEQEEPSFERLTNERMYFIVFQNNTFDIESRGNYLWAPTSDARGVWCHYWKRLTQVREGDVVFHCRGGEIQAVSIVKGSCYDQIAPSDPVYRANWGVTGKMVDTLYSLITNMIRTSDYRSQIMATYPAGSHYAPFDRNGDGNQGYLYELDAGLATTFLNDIMKKNPGWHI